MGIDFKAAATVTGMAVACMMYGSWVNEQATSEQGRIQKIVLGGAHWTWVATKTTKQDIEGILRGRCLGREFTPSLVN